MTGQIAELRKPRPVPAVVGRTDELSRIADFVTGPETGTRRDYQPVATETFDQVTDASTA